MQSIRISEEEIFDCIVYLGCKYPLETGKETRIREVYELGGPKIKIMSMETFLDISRLPMPNNEDVFWNKTIREICTTKTEVEGKKIFNEQVQELATWWSNRCESKDPSDIVECDAAGKASTHLLELFTEAKAKGKCGKKLPTSLPKFG
ncbi:hypothetical protein JTE90_014031 [Oedothorax gibbosus]|uniref:Uncharacterized protein n=1 Tax=Oedothorax gibbosus TaxID=931172 RepID=A0AAV6TNW5_9ARAC|nr:hypothetical protein JTE90_014031 [Oedothorax gibbosus]